MYKNFISMLCIILVISLPICFAEEIAQVITEEPYTSEEGYTELILNVNKYEPNVIVSSILEEQNIPVYAFLSALPTERISLPTIQSISVNVVEGNKSMVLGGVTYQKPHIYSWDDFGYLILKLKKIEKEKDVPDTIDIELEAKIRYEAEVTSHLIGGKEEKTLSEESGVELNEILANSRYVFFGGKGRILAERITGKTASFVLYNSEGGSISKFSVSEGNEGPSYSLVRGSSEPEDYVRVRVENVLDKTRNYARIIVGNVEQVINVNDVIYGYSVNKIEGAVIELKNSKGEVILVVADGNEKSTPIGNIKINKMNLGEEPFAEFSVDDQVNSVKQNGPISNTGCTLNTIRPDRVYITDKENNPHTLYLMTEAEKQYYGTLLTAPKTDTLAGVCGGSLFLKNIDTRKSVKITLLSGKKTGATETRFWLHLPVEKRAITLSPKAIDRQINKTTEALKKLEGTINNLDKVVKGWRKICLITTGAMLLINLVKGLGGWGKVAEEAKKETKKETKEQAAEKTARALEGLTTTDPGCAGYQKLNEFTFPDGTAAYINVKSNIPDIYYTCKDGKPSVIMSPILKKGSKFYVWSKDKAQFVDYTGSESEQFRTIRSTTVNGEKAVVVPLKNPGSLRYIRSQYEAWKITPEIADRSLYAVVYESRIDFWVLNGNIIDVGDYRIADEKDNGLMDTPLTSYSKTDRLGSEIYREIESQYLNRISDAQRRGKESVELDGVNYKIDTAQKFGEVGAKTCEQIMSKAQCVLIYNACDPVLCPPSRCNLDGKAKVENVIQSGFIGSTILCLPNLWKDGVVVPFCVAGWLASLKNLRSLLQGYVACLTNAKIKGTSTGVCDKARSIFICQIMWQEIISIFSVKRGLLGLLTESTIGTISDEGVTGISGAVKESSNTLDWFVNDYATNVFAAYKGRNLEEIGAELCKNAIAGKFPDIGKFFEEISEPENPVQFTAYFEENPYAPTLGQSRYQVWYHIYAGTPKGEQSVRYKVFLQSSEKPFLIIGQGDLKAGEYVDETIDKVGLSGYQEICVNMNGVNNCGFGKTVSTSYALTEAQDWWMRKVGGLAPEINKSSQCVPAQEGVTPSYVPMAAVERICAITNPYLGLGLNMEAQWTPVGRCGIEGGRDLGKCWQKMDLGKYPDLKKDVNEDICRNQQGVWCVNKTCDVTKAMMSFDTDAGHFECCYKGGNCKSIEGSSENTCSMEEIKKLDKIHEELVDLNRKLEERSLSEEEIKEACNLIEDLKLQNKETNELLADLKNEKFERVIEGITERKAQCEPIPLLKPLSAEDIILEIKALSSISEYSSNTCEKATSIYLNIQNIDKFSDESLAKIRLNLVETCMKYKDLTKAESYFYEINKDKLDPSLVEYYNYYQGVIYYMHGLEYKARESFQSISDAGSKYTRFANFFIAFLDTKKDYVKSYIENKPTWITKEGMIDSYNTIISLIEEPILKERLQEELNELRK